MADFDHKNPAYVASAPRRRMALDFYAGGDAVEKKDYLIQHPVEPDDQFKIRKQRATYRNFASPIVDVPVASINQDRPEPIIPSQLDALVSDADLHGTSSNAFFADVTRMAAGAGSHFVLVDMLPKAGETEADDTRSERGRMPYFVSVAAEDVIDWSHDSAGVLQWAVVQSEYYSATEPFEDGDKIKTLTVWRSNTWERYEKRDTGEYSLAVSGEHQAGEVPLVPFLYEHTGLMTGLAATDEVLSILRRIYRRDSELDKMLFDAAIPLLVIKGYRKEEAEGIVKATWASITLEDASSAIEYIEPAGTAYQAIASEIDKDVRSAYEIAMRQIKPSGMQAESAEAKRLDSRQLDAQLAKFARQCQSAEEKCWRIAAQWLGVDGKDISTPYNEDYSAEGIDYQLANVMIGLQRSGGLSLETLLRALEKMGVLPDDFDLEAELATIQREVGLKTLGQGLTLPPLPI